MTREEAKIILEAYIACESKKAHFECDDDNCDDNCHLRYEMGTVGEYNEAINIAIQALEQEPCDDATLKDIFCMGCEYKEQEPKTGYWIEDEYEMEVRCSACGEENDECSKYCPNCGTKMQEIKE